jgi:hypothetical protein
MSDQNPIVEGEVVSSATQIIIPPKPRPTAELEADADQTIGYLHRLASSARLDPELRMAMNDMKNTVIRLKEAVVRMGEEAQANHDKLVEIVRSQRLM